MPFVARVVVLLLVDFYATSANAAMGAGDVDDDVLGAGSDGDDLRNVFADFFLQL